MRRGYWGGSSTAMPLDQRPKPPEILCILVCAVSGKHVDGERGVRSTYADLRVSSCRSEPILPPTRNDRGRGLVLLVLLPRLVLVRGGQEPLELGERERLKVARVDRLGLVPAIRVRREPCSSSAIQTKLNEAGQSGGRCCGCGWAERSTEEPRRDRDMGPARLHSRNLEDFRSHGECSLPIKTRRMSLR
jgi:hypothetical protein